MERKLNPEAQTITQTSPIGFCWMLGVPALMMMSLSVAICFFFFFTWKSYTGKVVLSGTLEPSKAPAGCSGPPGLPRSVSADGVRV